ncbi:TPA: hypothetical protein ACH3X3_005081 [Trebouxia sp. C0006]
MYCAIDEAGSHVSSKSFRLVVGVYSQSGKDLLGSACSQPIRVMANNDIPHGAAHIPLVVNVRKDWVGWQTKNGLVSRCLWPSSQAPPASADQRAHQLEELAQPGNVTTYYGPSSDLKLQSDPYQLDDSSAGQLSLLNSRQESHGASANEQAEQLYGDAGLTVDQPTSPGFTGVVVGEGTAGLHGQQQDELPADLLNGLSQFDQRQLLVTGEFNCCEEMAFALPLLANGIRGETSYVQLLDDFDSSGGLGVPEGCFVSSNCCVLRHPSSPVAVETICDDGDGWNAAVPMVPFTAPAGVNFIAGSTYHGGQMPHFTLPPPPCQQIPEASSSPVESVSRSHSAPQLGKQRKRKGAIDLCNSSTVQTCPLHKAQANFRKSLRRGFLSPLAVQCTSEEHFSPCKARGGHPASPQAEDAWQTSDVEVQASLIQAEQDKADLLAKQLQACREEAAWLRSRVCQLQQHKHARDSAAARAAALSPSHTVAPEAQPAALLLVDVLTATHARENKGHHGNSGGKVEWVEGLIGTPPLNS